MVMHFAEVGRGRRKKFHDLELKSEGWDYRVFVRSEPVRRVEEE